MSMNLFLAISISMIFLVQAQTRCDTICANDFRCNSGRCILTECSENDLCFKYCFNCGGNETCYGSGPDCDYSSNLIYLNSNSLQISYVLLFASMKINE
ncbi:hypothetical protein BpHYR1_038730 [Brachionus plicatilis]|uniref:Uncharacterized protein n=1 Tax=Brachionus plicatilis TaxID=10195 RepID=A0A3M7S9Z9_BRAPC|nr:hypothetical protein BpHYR1_038730 [Brachionus plicatilis]